MSSHRGRLTAQERQILTLASAAATRAWAPYSGMRVGAVALDDTGGTHAGANYESASYGLTICAERAALCAAQQAGAGERLRLIAIVAHLPPHAQADSPVMPCGACRQLLAEAAARAGHDLGVLCATPDLRHWKRTTIASLLPDSFRLA
jgi:cytidine deaminase